MGRFTLDIAAEFLFGTKLDTLRLSSPIPYPHDALEYDAKDAEKSIAMKFSNDFPNPPF